MSKYKVDMFDTLAAADKRDFAFYDRLADDQKKGFTAPVVLRWMSATNDHSAEETLCLVNYIANNHFYDIWDYPDLQYKLIAACGTGRKKRHVWVPNAKQTKTKDKVTDFLLEQFPDVNDQELEIIRKGFTKETFTQFVHGSGCDLNRMKELIDAFKKK
jgi:hypothetical protein